MEGGSNNANTDSNTFRKKLKYLYKKIDTASSLLWSHESHLTGAAGKRLRSKDDNVDKQMKWKNKETQQTGYGEIAMASMTSLFNLFQTISRLINIKLKTDQKLKESLICKPEDYNMSPNSKFLDIGSGFGKPVFHSAFQVGCDSKGIEVVPARIEFCIDFFYEFIFEKNFWEEQELEKKRIIKTDTKSDDDETVINFNSNTDNVFNINLKSSLNHNKNANAMELNMQINNHLNKFYNDEALTSFNYIDFLFTNKINLNALNQNYFHSKTYSITENQHFLPQVKSYPEVDVNKECGFDEDFINLTISLEQINKSILVEDNTPLYDRDNIFNSYIPVLKFGKHFILDQITVEITPIDDHLYSNLIKTLLDSVYNESSDWEIFFNLNLNKYDKMRKISEIVDKIENGKILNLISFVNSIFRNKKSFVNYSFIHNYSYESSGNGTGTCTGSNLIFKNNTNNLEESKQNKKNHNKDFYEELKEELKIKEKQIKEQLENEEDISSTPEEELRVLKESLVDLKFTPAGDEWYKKPTFEFADATVPKIYTLSETSTTHFTHIYSYNKLMNKECRSKIAKILNKTNYKILAWYSNPKQTKKAGLKDFEFVCKFPMQSTSTEKFHVYVYIKTK